eukprot:6376766-Pyramimonas_sp.AAC.1
MVLIDSTERTSGITTVAHCGAFFLEPTNACAVQGSLLRGARPIAASIGRGPPMIYKVHQSEVGADVSC